MNFWFFLTILFSVLKSSNASYFPELQTVLDRFQYDPECVFNYTIINSKTIKKFPECETVYAIIVINNKTDLTVEQIKNGMKKMTTLNGGVRIENTTFQNISIFTVDYLNADLYPYGFHVKNNSELTDRGQFQHIYFYQHDNQEIEFRVENNPKLDAKFMCDFGYLHMYTEMIIQGNLRDCACPGGLITSSNIARFENDENCNSVFNGIKLYNISDSLDLSKLSKIEFIRGVIDIQNNTSLQNLSFLASLGDLKVNNYADNLKVILNLQNNPNMTRLGFPLLMEIQNVWSDGIKLANFENLHPDFCLTIEEMAFLLENRISFLNLQAKICADNRTTIHNNKICDFGSMSSLPDNCYIIRGDLVINSGDEEYLSKLGRFRYLFGSLAIQNTSLERAEPLDDILKYIVQLNDTYPVLQIVGNKNMWYSWYRVQNIITRKSRAAVIQDNHKDMLDEDCMMFHGKIDPGEKYQMKLDISGDQCGNGKRVQIVYRYPSGAAGTYFWILGIFLLLLSVVWFF